MAQPCATARPARWSKLLIPEDLTNDEEKTADRGGVTSAKALLLRRLGAETPDESGTAPKLNVPPIQKPFGLLDCRMVVGTNKRLESCETPVVTDGVSAILCHPKSPLPDASR
jgi:hypothetical protein